MDKKLVSSIDETKNGYVYENGLIEDDTEATKNLPDILELHSQVIEIMKYMLNPELIEMRKTAYEEYKQHMEDKYPNFSLRYYGTFMKVISGDDIMPLMRMLAQLHKVKMGEISLDSAEKNVGELLSKKYVK